MSTESPHRFTLYHDGSCNTCSREIRFYQRRRGADQIRFLDVSTASQADLGADLNHEDALARMHVRDEAGELIQGPDAFIAIWRRLPAMRWMGWIGAKPGPYQLLHLGYRLFLLWRKKFPSPAQCQLAAHGEMVKERVHTVTPEPKNTTL